MPFRKGPTGSGLQIALDVECALLVGEFDGDVELPGAPGGRVRTVARVVVGDVWAFGCVLFEMLTGKRAFDGEDVADTLAAVLRGDPDWHALPDDVPEHIRVLLRRSLEKDRSRRVADIAVARFLITEPFTGAELATPSVQATTAVPPRAPWRRAIPLAVTAIVVTGITAVVMWNMRPRTVAQIVRFPIALSGGQQFAQRSQILAVSPDGSRIAYVADDGQLYLRSMADANVRLIRGRNHVVPVKGQASRRSRRLDARLPQDVERSSRR